MKKIIFSIFALFLIAGSGSCQEKMDNEEEMKALIIKGLEVYNEGKLDLLDETSSPKYISHSVDVLSEDIEGIIAAKEGVAALRVAYPDFKLTVDEIIIKGDRIITLWSSTGINTGPSTSPLFGEVPATRKKVIASGVTIFRVADGKLVEGWQYSDRLPNLIQLGFTITPPE